MLLFVRMGALLLYYEHMKTLLIIALLAIGYPIWIVLAIIKDLVNVLYIPFDTQRYINTFAAFCNNGLKLSLCIHKPVAQSQVPEQSEHAPKQEVAEPKVIGFKQYAQVKIDSEERDDDPDDENKIILYGLH